MKRESFSGYILMFFVLAIAIGVTAFTINYLASKNIPDAVVADMDEDSADTVKVPVKPGTDSLYDQIAEVFFIRGEAHIQKSGQPFWRKLKVATQIQKGDKLRTGPDSFIDVRYDDFYLNTFRLGPNALVQFTAIEPTLLRVYQGKILTALDAVPEGSEHQIATPKSMSKTRDAHIVRGYDPESDHDETMITEGSAEVMLRPDNGDEPLVGPISVSSGEALKVTPLTNLKEVRTEQISTAEMTDLSTQFAGVEENLLKLAGSDALNLARQTWEEKKNNPKEMLILSAQTRPRYEDEETFVQAFIQGEPERKPEPAAPQTPEPEEEPETTAPSEEVTPAVQPAPVVPTPLPQVSTEESHELKRVTLNETKEEAPSPAKSTTNRDMSLTELEESGIKVQHEYTTASRV